MKKLITTIMVCFISICAVPRPAASQSKSSPMTGTWQCVSHDSQGGNLNFTLNLKQNGSQITGGISLSNGDLVIKSGTFKANRLEITVQGGNGSYKAEATYTGGKLTGSWSAIDSSRKGTWEGTRAAKSSQ